MKTKKCGVYAALAAVLLVTVMLVTTHTEPSTPDGLTVLQEKEPERFVPPEGKGYVRLNLSVEKFSQAARTSTPVIIYDEFSDFASVEIEFVATTGGASISAQAWNGITVIALTPGTYTIQVVGYNAGTVAVGYGEATGIVVAAAGGADADIVIKEIVDGSGTGTLSWTFTNTGTVTSATLNIVGLSAGAQDDYDTINYDLLSGALFDGGAAKGLVSTLTLDSGYYRLTLALVKAGHASATIREIVHIWNGHVTPFSKVLTLNPNVHTVIYDHQDLRTIAQPEEEFTHAQTLTHPAYVTGPITEPQYLTALDAPIVPAKHFVGWFTKDGTPAPTIPDWGTQWVVGTTPVIRSLTLFARWGGLVVSISYNEADFEFSFEEQTGPTTWATISNPATYTMNQDTPRNIRVTIDNAGDFPVGTTFNWYYGPTSLGTGATFTIPYATSNAYWLAGPHTFSVEASGGIAGGDVTFTTVLTP